MVARVDKRKKKNAYTAIRKAVGTGKLPAPPIKTGLLKFSYYGSKLIYIVAIVMMFVTVYFISIKDHYWFDYIWVPMWGFLIGLGLMLSAIYKGAAMGAVIKAYSLPMNAEDEQFSINGDNYVYSFKDDSLRDGGDFSKFIFSKSDIGNMQYDKTACIITLFPSPEGKIIEERYKGEKLISSNEWEKLSLLDIFKDIDLYKEFHLFREIR